VLAAERLRGDDTHVPILAKGKTIKGHIWTWLTTRRVGVIERRLFKVAPSMIQSLPSGGELLTLRDAGDFIAKLPKRKRDAPERQRLSKRSCPWSSTTAKRCLTRSSHTPSLH
jgi:hypothetical protein